MKLTEMKIREKGYLSENLKEKLKIVHLESAFFRESCKKICLRGLGER